MVPPLFAGLVDDASLLPPSMIHVPEAVDGFRRHSTAWYRELVGALLVPSSLVNPDLSARGLTVGVINDAAYDLPAGTISDPVTSLPANELHAYGIRELKEAMSVAIVQDVGSDAFVSFVATLPANRGEHLASRILAHAMHEAHERGQITTSLQASKLGQGIYARLGYQPLGEIHLYERRP